MHATSGRWVLFFVAGVSLQACTASNPYVAEEASYAKRALREKNLEACRRYLKKFYVGYNRDQVLAVAEPLFFAEATTRKTSEAGMEYLDFFGKSPRHREIRKLLDPILFQEAEAGKRVFPYQQYLRYCPEGRQAATARRRMEDLQAHVKAECPQAVAPGPGQRWSWTMVLRETGGKVGCKLKGTGYIQDRRGQIWGNLGGKIERGELVLSAGGVDSDSYWCSSADHVLCNGKAVFSWSGPDDNGNSVGASVVVQLVHQGCPGPQLR
ncbi:MAG TPA: hypothetical protein VI893_03755 [Thermoplasmata archaeon]|nr:hypothetical protein [Thermoplasmata archaeon]